MAALNGVDRGVNPDHDNPQIGSEVVWQCLIVQIQGYLRKGPWPQRV